MKARCPVCGRTLAVSKKLILVEHARFGGKPCSGGGTEFAVKRISGIERALNRKAREFDCEEAMVNG
jgi:hypothetical protein